MVHQRGFPSKGRQGNYSPEPAKKKSFMGMFSFGGGTDSDSGKVKELEGKLRRKEAEVEKLKQNYENLDK